MTLLTPTDSRYYIKPRAVSFAENDLGDVNRVYVSIASGTTIMVYVPEDDLIPYDEDKEYQKWVLTGYPTKLATSDAYYIYARLSRSDNRAIILFSTKKYKVDGSIEGAEGENNPSDQYFYVPIGSLTSSEDEEGKTVSRALTFDSGKLSTPDNSYTKEETDSTFMSFEVADNRYLNALDDDTAQGIITFEKGLRLPFTPAEEEIENPEGGSLETQADGVEEGTDEKEDTEKVQNFKLINAVVSSDNIAQSELFTDNALLTAAAFNKLFSVMGAGTEEDPFWIRANYTLASVGSLSVLGLGNDGGQGGAGISYSRLDTWEGYDPATMAGYVLSAALGHDLLTRIENLPSDPSDPSDPFDPTGYATQAWVLNEALPPLKEDIETAQQALSQKADKTELAKYALLETLADYATTASVSKAISVADSLTNTNTGLTDGYINSFTADTLKVTGDFSGNGWSVEGSIAYFGELNATSVSVDGKLEATSLSAPSITIDSLPVATEKHVADNYYDKDEITAIQAAINTEITANKDAISSLSTLLNKWFYEKNGVLYTSYPFASEKTVSVLGAGSGTGGSTGGSVSLDEVNSDILPVATDWYSIGSATLRWKELYAADINVSSINSVSLTGDSIATTSQLTSLRQGVSTTQITGTAGPDNYTLYFFNGVTNSSTFAQIPSYYGRKFTDIESTGGLFLADEYMVTDILDYVDDAVGNVDVSASLENYYTKTQIDSKGFLTASSLSGYATQEWVEQQGYEANVQSDWNVADTTSDAYIKNKPTIPTVVNDLTTSNAKNALSAAQGVELKKLTDANAADILTIAEALQGYVTTDQLPTLKSLMGSSAIGSTTSFIWWNGSAWKTQSLSTYATLDDVTAVYDYIDGIDFSSYLTDYATKEWVEDNYYTATQIDNKLIPFVTLEGDTATWARHHIFQDGTIYPITVNGVGDRTGINFTKDSVLWGKLGFSAVNTPAFFTTEGSAEPLATQSWVEGKDYLLSSSFNKANIKSTLGISDWALAASKPFYAWNEITSKPTFATVATSGSYDDLSDTPTIPTVVNDLTTSNAKNALSAAQGVELKKLADANAVDILTIAEALQDYATTDQLPTLNSLMGSSAIGSTTSFIWWNGSAWKTQTLSTYATLDDVTAVYDYIDGIDFSSYLTDYATKEWVGGNYYTATQIDNKLIPFVTLEGGTATWARHHIFQDGTIYPITVNGVGDRTGINFTKDSVLWGKLGFSAVNTPAFFTTEGSAETLATQSWVTGKGYLTGGKNASDFRNGYLVRTTIKTASNTMLNFSIIGNSYNNSVSYTRKSFQIHGQFYCYKDSNNILQIGAVSLGDELGDIKVFCYDDGSGDTATNKVVCLWFQQTASFQSFSVSVFKTISGTYPSNVVASITNAEMPTSGVTRLKTITPYQVFFNSGGTIDGNLTVKGSLTVNGSITTSSKLTINNGASLEVQGNAYIGGTLYAGLSTNNPYATQSWVGNQGYVTTTQLANYLPLAGGTMNKGALIKWADDNGDYDWSTVLGKGFKIIDYNANASVNEYSVGLHIGGSYYKAQLAYNFSNGHWKYRTGASSFSDWKWLIDSTGGTIDGSLTVNSDIFGNGWSVEGGIANFGELNATDISADSVTVGDTSVASKSYTIPAVSAKRWVRIAEMTSYISCGTITISKNYNSIPTQHAVFHVQSGYVQSDGIKAEYNITQLACTCNPNSDQYFTKVRIVYANPTTSTSKAYVEVYCNFDKSETLKISLSSCTNMSLLSVYTLGSVPTGYDYRSIYLQPGGARNECYQMIDLSASTYNRDYFYPVVGSKLSASGGFTRIEIRNNLNNELENNVPSWSTHTRGFTANMVVYARGSEYGVNVGQTFCVDYNYSHTTKNPVGYSQMANASLPVLWLRGGGKYNVYTDRLMRWNVKTSTFTSNSESVAPQSGGTAPFRFTKANLYANIVGYVNSSNANTFTAKQSFTSEIEVSKTDMVAPITIQGAENKSFVKFTSGTTNLGFLGFKKVNEPAWMPNDATEYIPLASQSWVNTKAEQVGVTANGTYITFGDEDTSIFASGTIVMRGEVQLGSTYRYGFTEIGDGNLLSLTAQTVTQTSDLTRKNILSYDPQFSVRDIANAPIAYFTWREGRDTTSQHLGSIAQYWSLLAPECVHGAEGNDMSMEYATLGLVTSIINAREIVRIADQTTATDSRLNAALQRIADLEAEVAALHSRLGDLPPG